MVCSEVDASIDRCVAPRRTRFDQRPNPSARRPPLFDSHMHFDRSVQMGINFEWFDRLRASQLHDFTGCVAIFCDPPIFDVTSKSYNILGILAAMVNLTY